jgi:myo-inositol catabolism protein IolC
MRIVGLRSWIEPELADRLCAVLEATGAMVVLISDWRCNRTVEDLKAELTAAGVVCELAGTTPVLGQARWREIEAYMQEHDLLVESVVILDDGFDMGPLAARFVRTSPLNGLDDAAVDAIQRLFSP